MILSRPPPPSHFVGFAFLCNIGMRTGKQPPVYHGGELPYRPEDILDTGERLMNSLFLRFGSAVYFLYGREYISRLTFTLFIESKRRLYSRPE